MRSDNKEMNVVNIEKLDKFEEEVNTLSDTLVGIIMDLSSELRKTARQMLVFQLDKYCL